MEKFYAKSTQLSVASSTDEGEDLNDTFDLPTFILPSSETTVAIDKNRKYDKAKDKTRIHGRKVLYEKRKKVRQDLGMKQVDKTRKLAGVPYSHTPKEKFEYSIDINVYRFDDYPEYKSPLEDKTWIEKEIEEIETNSEKTKLKERRQRGYKKVTTKSRDYFYWNRKKRTASYKRIHEWYNEFSDEDKNQPDDEIPSYKAKMRSVHYRDKTIAIVVNTLLEQTMTSINRLEKARKRKEGTHYSKHILSELCDQIVMDIEEKQRKDAVKYGIEVLIDQWEEHVYQTRMRLIEEQMDIISEEIVTSAIKNTINNIVEEDIYSTLIVRDTLAESLKEIGMRQARINTKLTAMFYDYRFNNYDFDKGSVITKNKHRQYKSRKQLDSYLEERLQKLHLGYQEENRAIQRKKDKEIKEKNKKEKQEEELELTKKAVLEKKKSFYPPPESEEEVIDEEERSPLYLTPENTDMEELNEQRDTHELFDPVAMENVAYEAHRRKTVVALWTAKHKEMIETLRKEGLEEYEGKQETESEEEKEDKQVDLNKLYENAESSADDEKEFVDTTKLELPNLKFEVQKAFFRANTPTEIHTIQIERIERIDSAVLAEINARKPKIRASMRKCQSRQDSGINSIATGDHEEFSSDEDPEDNNDNANTKDNEEDSYNSDNSENTEDEDAEEEDEYAKEDSSDDEDSTGEKLVKRKYEKNITHEEIVKLIPKLDSEYYLQSWLHDGVPKIVPSPPISPNDKKVRRLYLKRPQTAMSEETIHDVVPIDFEIYATMKNTGRLNSALSNERSETENSFYTGRVSSFSNREEDFKEENDESEDIGEIGENEENKKLKWIEKKKPAKKQIKIEFKKTKKKSTKDIEDRADDTPAWNFYRKTRRMKEEEEEQHQKVASGKEYKIQIPPKELSTHEKEEIISKSAVKLDERMEEGFDEDEEIDKEILRAQMNTSDEEENKEQSEINQKSTEESMEPPSTPWQRDRERPITPDSEDSEEEFEKLRNNYINHHVAQRELEKSKNIPERRWKGYLKKKTQLEDTHPGMPKSGWKAHPSLIPWKNANEEVRKYKTVSNNNQEAQVNHNRELFQRLQIMANREQKQERLLVRRKTIHEEREHKKSEKLKKLGLDSSTEDSRPVTTKSNPSYMKNTKSTEYKYEKDKDRLPAINNSNNDNANRTTNNSAIHKRKAKVK